MSVFFRTEKILDFKENIASGNPAIRHGLDRLRAAKENEVECNEEGEEHQPPVPMLMAEFPLSEALPPPHPQSYLWHTCWRVSFHESILLGLEWQYTPF